MLEPNFVISQVLKRAALEPNSTLAVFKDSTASMGVFEKDVLAAASRLFKLGLKPGDRVAICYPTDYAHTVLDFAVLAAGGVAVPIYETDSQEQIEWILKDADPVVVISHQDHMSRVKSAHSKLSHRSLLFNDLSAKEIVDEGFVKSKVEAIQSGLTSSSLAVLIYTSGTTGRSKGCMLTHGNLAFAVKAASTALPELIGPKERTVLFLPLAHVFAKVVQYACVCGGVQISYSTPATIVEDLAIFKPTWLTVVPRVLEKVYSSAEANATGIKSKIFASSVKTALSHAESLESNTKTPPSLLWKLHNKLVYQKLISRLGGSLKFVLSGGAPLDPVLDRFFTGAGITVLEGYGLTETSAAHTVSRPGSKKAGTVGEPLEGCSVKVLDGELLLSGPNVFPGYWNNQDATDSTFHVDKEGIWLRSGDLGSVDSQNRVSITGRIKDLLITASGKNVQPSGLEELIVQNPAFSQCVVVGDKRPYITALLAVNPAWAAANNIVVDDSTNPLITAAAKEAIDRANMSVSNAESIKKWALLPKELSVEDGFLTATLKTKRPVVASKYKDLIESLYKD
jgi:long-chain acyl-CoA synthetase